MSERAIDRWITGALIVYTLGVAAALLMAGAHPVGIDGSLERGAGLRPALAMGAANLTYDDGYYYLQIARHIARGGGSTFDGVNPTNGYHPLWLFCLVPIFWLTSAPDVALLLAVLLQGVLMSAATGLTYRIARLDLGRFGAVLAALLWVHCQLLYRITLSGLEYSLQAAGILSAVFFYRRWVARGPASLRAHLGLGTLLALTFLARLDSLALFGAIALALGLHERRGGFGRAGTQRLLALGSPVAAAVLLYAGVNLRMFGHVLPINGVIKREWSARLLQEDPHFRAHGWLAAKLANVLWPFGAMKPAYVLFLVAGSAGISALWLLALAAGRESAPPASPVSPAGWRATIVRFARPTTSWGPVVLFGVVQLSFFLVLYHDGYSFQRWYYVIQPWLGAMLLAMIAESAWRQAKSSSRHFAGARFLPSLMAIGILAAVPLGSARTVRQWRDETLLGSSRIPLYAAGQWVRANVPEGAVVGAWNAGVVSYLSGRRVVNLDGLVNSWDFHETKQHDLCAYWGTAGVTHLVDTFALDQEVPFVNKYYSPDVDLSPCAGRLERVWVGPAYPSTSEHAMAFRLR